MKLSNCDFEDRWQGICYSYELRGEQVPRSIRLIRRAIERLIEIAERLAR